MRRFAFKRLGAAVPAAALVVAVAAVSAIAVPVNPGPRQPGGSLTDVGPISPDHGFPIWYGDSNGVRLEPCTTPEDELCPALADEIPDPAAQVSFPDNFPGEFFYQLAGATVTGTGVNMTVGMDLEGAFGADAAADGQQMVFGRIRIRDKAIADGTYRVTHPYGADEFTVEGDGINYTEDIGVTGGFGQALSSRIGPFLQWDPEVAPAAPEGYVGDPSVAHKVIGSPYDTNFVKVERLEADGTYTELARTDLFEIQGRKATNSGLDVQKATYSTGADGKGVVEVFASSDPDQVIQVEDTGLGYHRTTLEGDDRRYYGRLPLTEAPEGKTVTVVNAGDKPVTRKAGVDLVDVVTVSRADYDAAARTLTVAASSSDQDSTPGALKVHLDSEDAGTAITNGQAVLENVIAPPAAVTVKSDKGGSASMPVSSTGATMAPDKPVAAAFAAPAPAAPGQKVTLTGTGSMGTIDAYEWKQVDATAAKDAPTGELDENGDPIMGPSTEPVPVTDANRVTLTGGDQAVAEFTAPSVEGPIAFELVVKGGAGASEPVTVQVDIRKAMVTNPDTGEEEPTTTVTADAGEDQTVRRGAVVNLDGTASVLADDYRWTQVSGPNVTIDGATTARPSFTFPLMPLPALNTTGNPTYTTTAEPIVLELTVNGQGDQTATDRVTVTPQQETLRITRGEYRAGDEWRVEGTSDILAGQRVAVIRGDDLTGRVLGYANVNALGTFSFRGAADITPSGATSVSAVSALGDDHTGFVFRNR